MAMYRGDKLDKEEFERLFRQEIARLHNFARQYVPDSDSAMDICQQVFVRLWEKRDALEKRDSLTSYLYTSVKNRCLNYIRDQKKYRSRFLDLECADLDVPDSMSDPEATEDLEKQIQIALAALPEKCRQVFEMSRFGEMKYREIAEALEISQKTVEAHMSKAMRLLRDSLRTYRVWLWLLLYLFIQ
jgi:RNA polymerase sigma-70 factor (ECF subfamily)